MKTSTWNRDYEINMTGDNTYNITNMAIDSITNNDTDITDKIFADSIIGDFATALVHEMARRQITICNNEREIDSLCMEVAYLQDAVKKACK